MVAAVGGQAFRKIERINLPADRTPVNAQRQEAPQHIARPYNAPMIRYSRVHRFVLGIAILTFVALLIMLLITTHWAVGWVPGERWEVLVAGGAIRITENAPGVKTQIQGCRWGILPSSNAFPTINEWLKSATCPVVWFAPPPPPSGTIIYDSRTKSGSINVPLQLRSWVVSIPLWILLLVMGFPIALAWRRNRRGRVPNHCETCNYRFTGNVSGICPECGTPIPTMKLSIGAGEGQAS